MAGTQAGTVGTYAEEALDKAQLTRVLAKGLKLHLSQLPPLLTMHTNLEAYPLGD
jgi:hypothetical protein